MRGQRRCRCELHPLAGPTSAQADRRCQMRFSGSAVSNEPGRVVPVNPLASRQFQNPGLADGRREGEVEVGQFLHQRESRQLDAVGQRVGRAGRQFQFAEAQQIALDYRVIESRPVDRHRGLRADQTIKLRGPLSRKRYPSALRRVSFTDAVSGNHLVFLTNNFTLAALTITKLYKARWQVELFFKWIKQYLRIKVFFGNTPNAVKTQVWIAVSAYVLVAIARRELNLRPQMGEILQVLSLMLFEKTPVFQVFSHEARKIDPSENHNSLYLFDF